MVNKPPKKPLLLVGVVFLGVARIPLIQSVTGVWCTPNVRVPMVFVVFSMDSWGL